MNTPQDSTLGTHGALERPISSWAKDWAQQKHYCPHCAGAAFVRVESTVEGNRIVETLTCLRIRCRGSWKVEYLERAVCIVPTQDETEETDGDWIPLPHTDAPGLAR